MGELIQRIRKFRFKGILVILLVFSLMASILFIELSGIRINRYQRSPELLSSSQIRTLEQVSADLDTKALLLRDSTNTTSQMAYDQLAIILADMKVGYRCVDVAVEDIPSFGDYEQAILCLSDLSPMGTHLTSLVKWVKEGGECWIPVTPELNSYSSTIMQMLGVDSVSSSYYTVESIYLHEGFMIGGGKAFTITNPFESSLTVILSEERTKVYASAENTDGVPLVWKAQYGEGEFVVNNLGMYEKAMRGFYAASYSLLSEVCAYPVINGSVFYLDDFPSQIPDGNSEYIQRDYQTTIRDFYINIWWPDMMNYADRYGIKYTGLAIESYDDNVDGQLDAQPDTGTFINFGNMLLRKGGELGYHGYNHQPLTLHGDYTGYYDYKVWQSENALKGAFDHLVNFCQELFPDTDFCLYVPPLQPSGRGRTGDPAAGIPPHKNHFRHLF